MHEPFRRFCYRGLTKERLPITYINSQKAVSHHPRHPQGTMNSTGGLLDGSVGWFHEQPLPRTQC
jgi:hypothetical protein